MSSTYCSKRGCRNLTLNPSGRCYLHENGGAGTATPKVSFGPPSSASSSRTIEDVRVTRNFGTLYGVDPNRLPEELRLRVTAVDPLLLHTPRRAQLPQVTAEYRSLLEAGTDPIDIAYPLHDISEEEYDRWLAIYPDDVGTNTATRSIALCKGLQLTVEDVGLYMPHAQWNDLQQLDTTLPFTIVRARRVGIKPEGLQLVEVGAPESTIESASRWLDAYDGASGRNCSDADTMKRVVQWYRDDWGGSSAGLMDAAGVTPRQAKVAYNKGVHNYAGIIAHVKDGAPVEWAVAYGDSQ